MRIPVLGFLVLASAMSHAWIDTGHMVVSAIAEGGLKPEVRAQVERLLRIGGDEKTRDILGAACWADDTKTAENGPWHYINVHFRADGAPTNNKPLPENVVWAIEKFEAVLKDRSRTEAERADALRYLLHFVGDVHQPFHSVARDCEDHPTGDRGGNDFVFDEFPLAGFNVRNLHFLWDIGGGLYGATPRPLASRSTIDQLADRLRRENPRENLPELGAMAPMAWAMESLTIAQSVGYSIPERKRPNEPYLAMVRFISERRLVVAGYRLADMLNRILAQ